MKITHIEIRKLKLPMTHTFTTGFGVIRQKETVIVKLQTADGLTGYGESSALSIPLFNGETADTCMYILERFLAPAVVGKNLNSIEDFLSALPVLQNVYTAKTGLECAFWHLLSQRDNTSLKALLGGTRKQIAVGESIDIKPSLQELMQEVEQRLDEGYRRIKLKIKPGWDLEPLAAVRNAWPEILLTADANASYDLNRHGEILRALDSFQLAMLEQPLAPRSFVDHAALQEQIQTPICFDESIQEFEDARTAHELGAGRIINLKPMRLGGLYECLRIYDYAAENGMGVWCGGTLETGIGRAFNIALASKEGCEHPADMSIYQIFFAEDLVESSFVVTEDGYIEVPDEPGLGYTVSDGQVEKFTTQKKIITA